MQGLTINKLSDYSLISEFELLYIRYAFLISEGEIHLILKKEFENLSEIKIYDHLLKQVKTEIIRDENDELSYIIRGDFVLTENYVIRLKQDIAYIILDPAIGGIIDNYFFSEDTDLGVCIKKDKISFKFWSPPAAKVELNLLDKTGILLLPPLKMNRIESKPGYWERSLFPEEIVFNENEPVFYQYKITAYGKEYIALDPYARSMAVFDQFSDDIIGKAALIDMNSDSAKPKNFKRNYLNFDHIANENDIIVYEINVRDFTIQPGIVESSIAGTYKGFKEKINYLKELGITHVQLMPVNKAFTQNEKDRSYSGKYDNESRYNWGYDPLNYFTLEGRYSSDPYDPYIRIFEFRQLVQALHDAGIGVIVDVVFNHTFNADVFEHVAPGCYYRYTDEYRISVHTGAGPTIESRRKQVRKFIKDVLKFWIEEYHIDGFRFDLMSFTDKETMIQIRNEAGKIYNPKNINELILQGEAWNFTDLRKDAYIKTDFVSLNIGIFNDTFRDSVAGNGHYPGFIHGNKYLSGKLASGITGGIRSFDQKSLPFYKNDFFEPYNLFADSPSDCLNFISIHDGLTLWDKLNISVKDKSKKERLRLMKFAAAILFSSQGKIILHGGDEILRTKPKAEFDKESHRTVTSEFTDIEEETVFFHENSYCSNDFTNKFRWSRLTDEYSLLAQELLNYYKSLINMRRNISAFRMTKSENIRHGLSFLQATETANLPKYISFKDPDIKSLTLKFINGKPDDKLFLTGEIHHENDNPVIKPVKIEFDKDGTGTASFTTEEIQRFNLQKWSESRFLNVKLVKTPGSWDSPEEFYSPFGNNSLAPESINEKNEIKIDLSVKDYVAHFENTFHQPDFTAFTLNNCLEDSVGKGFSGTEFKTILVIHNPQTQNLKLYIPELIKHDFFVIADEKNAGIQKLEKTNVLIRKDYVYIPGQSTAILASYNIITQ